MEETKEKMANIKSTFNTIDPSIFFFVVVFSSSPFHSVVVPFPLFLQVFPFWAELSGYWAPGPSSKLIHLPRPNVEDSPKPFLRITFSLGLFIYGLSFFAHMSLNFGLCCLHESQIFFFCPKKLILKYNYKKKTYWSPNNSSDILLPYLF